MKDYDIHLWTDEQICRFLDSSGTIPQVHIGIFGHVLVDIDDPRWNHWRKPEHHRLRRAVANAYLYGIHVHNLAGSNTYEV